MQISSTCTTPTFETVDTGLAASLLHGGFVLIDIDRTQPSFSFIFEDSEELRKAVGLYWKDQLMVPAQSFVGTFRRTKRLLHSYQP